MPGSSGNLNALRHGLTARAVVLPHEAVTVYRQFERLWLRDLAPVGSVEEFLAHRIVAAAWRLARVERLEGSMASSGLERSLKQLAARTEDGAAPRWTVPEAHRYAGLAALARHEASIERGFFRSLHELQDVQRERGRAAKPRAGKAAGFGGCKSVESA